MRAVNGLADQTNPLSVAGAVGPPFSLIPSPERVLMYVQSLTGMAILIGNAKERWLTEYSKACIQQADTIIVDSPRCESVQLYKQDEAEWIHLNNDDTIKLSGKDGEDKAINLMLKKVRSGRRVARLFADNIDFFDKGYKEADVLSATGIRYELVPGVSELSAVLTILGVSPFQKSGQFIHIIDGRDQVKAEKALADMDIKDMYCVFNATLSLPNIVAALKRNPFIDDLPAVMVSDAGTFEQKLIRGKLSEMPQLSVAANIPLHGMLLFGESFRPGTALDWWPPRGPLSGKRVGVVAAKLTEEKRHIINQSITTLGGTPYLLEGMYTRMDDDLAKNMDRRLSNLFEKRLDARGVIWIALLSVNGAKSLVASLQRQRVDFRSLGKVRFAVLNTAIAAQLESSGLAADYIAERGDSRNLGEWLLKKLNSRDQLVVVRGGRQTSVLTMLFQMANLSYIDIRGYETVPIQMDRMRLVNMLSEVDLLIFTTSASVETFENTSGKWHRCRKIDAATDCTNCPRVNYGGSFRKHGLEVTGASKDGSITN